MTDFPISHSPSVNRAEKDAAAFAQLIALVGTAWGALAQATARNAERRATRRAPRTYAAGIGLDSSVFRQNTTPDVEAIRASTNADFLVSLAETGKRGRSLKKRALACPKGTCHAWFSHPGDCE